MSSIAVIQARSNSARLPGKVLLDLAGMPIVVLAARRAGNVGRNVLVVTSSESTDDHLAEVLTKHGIACFRGGLDDVLERFIDALRDHSDDTIVFRLTADNVVPDGALLEEVEREFLSRRVPYMCCNGEMSGLPYGVSVEITRLKYLRIAHEQAVEPSDREHVTAWIARHYGRAYFDKYKSLGMGGYRCTIDCFDDYLVAADLFRYAEDPIQISALDLIVNLVGMRHQPSVLGPTTKLVLGTAQLGMRYGIANISGRPNRDSSREIIRTAIRNGLRAVDTARAYGDSEEVLGHALTGGWQGRIDVITKLSPMTDCPADASEPVVRAFADASFFRSASALGSQRISTLLFHRADHAYAWNGSLKTRLLEYRNEGRIDKIGVSVQNCEELSRVLRDEDIQHVQLPYNILDARCDSLVNELEAVRAKRGLTVHVRSVLLQGLLSSRSLEHWVRARIAEPQPVWDWLDELTRRFGRESVIDLSIAFAAAQSWVDGIVIGLENMNQLMDNLALFQRPCLTNEELAIVGSTRPQVADSSLNPAMWASE